VPWVKRGGSAERNIRELSIRSVLMLIQFNGQKMIWFVCLRGESLKGYTVIATAIDIRSTTFLHVDDVILYFETSYGA